MPSGRTHDRITFWMVPLILGIAYFLTQNGKFSLIVAGGFLFSGLMFGPDLDIHSVQYKRWGWLRWIWIPYRSAIRHRSHFSHGLIIGTFLRLVYLGAIVLISSGIFAAIAYFLGYVNWHKIIGLQTHFSFSYQKYWQVILSLIIGLELGAMSHSVSDWIGSAVKKNKSSKTRSQFTSTQQPKPNKKRKSKK